ncbi:MAG: hypothetical protein J1E56_04045 [Ruminococcus sp.]|nr:hypothetical protein [Ruminococcus sp.]
MKKILIIVSALILCFMFSSCTKTEIDKNAIIESIYVSKSGDILKFEFNTVKNENTAVLKKYRAYSDSLENAKSSLESSAVPHLFLGQLECIVISNQLDLEEVRSSLGYFKSSYECSPGVRLLFATNKAVKELEEKEIPVTRLAELSDLSRNKNSDTSVNIYTFYNSLSKLNEEAKVNLLYSESQLDVKAMPFSDIRGESE